MVSTRLDHIVITANSLDEGVQYVESVLGVKLAGGGQHPRMGTHNRLLRLGDDCYLEVIAIDPSAAPAQRPRWFGLDTRPTQPACLTTWVARSTDIAASCARARYAPGVVQPMTRGSLSWQITIPDDGALQEHGLLPALIQWDQPPGPAASLPDQGCTLLSLDLFHPQSHVIEQQIDSLGFEGCVRVYPAHNSTATAIKALIQTPDGVRQL